MTAELRTVIRRIEHVTKIAFSLHTVIRRIEHVTKIAFSLHSPLLIKRGIEAEVKKERKKERLFERFNVCTFV